MGKTQSASSVAKSWSALTSRATSDAFAAQNPDELGASASAARFSGVRQTMRHANIPRA